jgi:hypothetical protein
MEEDTLMLLSVKCPFCKGSYNYEFKDEFKELKCGGCGNDFYCELKIPRKIRKPKLYKGKGE